MKKVFPELDFVELPVNYAIYHQKYSFPTGFLKYMSMMATPAGFAYI